MTTTSISTRIAGSVAALLLILLFMMPHSASAQKKYKTFGRKCAAVSITDPGEMYSTYELSSEEQGDILKSGVSEDLMGDILGYDNEGSWPEAMTNLDSRLENAAVIMKYKAFKVATWDSKCVLVIPAKYNANMPQGFAPDHDFYMIINKIGIK